MSFIFIVVLRACKSLTPKDVTAVKGLISNNVMYVARNRFAEFIIFQENGRK
jgi:hypothetical protein